MLSLKSAFPIKLTLTGSVKVTFYQQFKLIAIKNKKWVKIKYIDGI